MDPAPAPFQPPPPPKSKFLPCCLTALGVFVVFGILVCVGMYLGGKKLVTLSEEHTQQKRASVPGFALFEALDDKQKSRGAKGATGNSPLASQIANSFYLKFMARCDADFPKTESGMPPMGGPAYVTYCHETENAFIFLVNGPRDTELTTDQETKVQDIAWEIANQAIREAGGKPDARVVIGLRGSLFYDAVLQGTQDPSGDVLGGLEDRAEGLDNKEILYEYLAPPAPATGSPATPAPAAP